MAQVWSCALHCLNHVPSPNRPGPLKLHSRHPTLFVTTLRANQPRKQAQTSCFVQQSSNSSPAPSGSSKSKKVEAQRLSKILAAAGVASRRAAEEIIIAGRVSVNDKIEPLPQRKVVPGKDKILVDGNILAVHRPKQLYFALNKPKGYICSNKASLRDQQSPKLVVDLLSGWLKRLASKPSSSQNLPPRLYTVGRLDVQSTGLILVTNDGSWANEVAHPSSGITKEYIVTTSEAPNKKQLRELAQGCMIDGTQVQPIDVQLEASDPSKRNKIRLVLSEGKNREVRQLVSSVGLEVTYLKRVRIGGYRLPTDLGIGQFRELKVHEVRRVLDKGAQANPYL
ncbi:hypothetical protein WJX79_005702 [Trebouxia sp. C0005]